MASVRQVSDLEVPENLAYQRREWTFQRLGWVVMALVVLAGLLGLIGRGPLSDASASDPTGTLRLEYERFGHYHQPTALKFYLSGEATRAAEVRLWISGDYLRAIDIQQITPAPEHVEAGSGRHVFVFRVADRGQPTLITFHFEFDEHWAHTGQAGLGDEKPLSFTQFVYP